MPSVSFWVDENFNLIIEFLIFIELNIQRHLHFNESETVPIPITNKIF